MAKDGGCLPPLSCRQAGDGQTHSPLIAAWLALYAFVGLYVALALVAEAARYLGASKKVGVGCFLAVEPRCEYVLPIAPLTGLAFDCLAGSSSPAWWCWRACCAQWLPWCCWRLLAKRRRKGQRSLCVCVCVCVCVSWPPSDRCRRIKGGFLQL